MPAGSETNRCGAARVGNRTSLILIASALQRNEGSSHVAFQSRISKPSEANIIRKGLAGLAGSLRVSRGAEE